MRRSFLFLPLLFGVAIVSCRKGDSRCDASTVCTEEFRSISVRLVKANGAAPDIDSVQTLDERGARLRTSEGRPAYGMNGAVQSGRVYAHVVDDEWLAGNTNSELRVTFRGFRDGAVVFEEGFTIGADCCHVYKSAGPDLITVPD